jgi:hypothetical protein
VDRVAYGGGFEDFLAGMAKCIVSRRWRSWPSRALNNRRQEIFKSTSLVPSWTSPKYAAARARSGKKLTLPRIPVVGTIVYGVPSSWLRRKSVEYRTPQQVPCQSILTSAIENERMSVGGEAFKI